MPDRGETVDYTYAVQVDVQGPDGIWRPQVGFNTLPAIVLADRGAAGVDLKVISCDGSAYAYPGDSLVLGVQAGPAAPDTKQGRRVDPTAQIGQPGTWS